MKPVGLRFKSAKGFQIVHECLRCGGGSTNRVAEHTLQPDDIEALIALQTSGGVLGPY